MSEPLSVKLSLYEGPLDLLLDLIKKNEMDITNIPMAEITSQYLDHLSRMKQLNLEIAGEFLVMAATLLLIKSRMLLPPDEELLEGEDGAGDPRAELVRKLLEYQAFREVARSLESREDERSRVFTRQIADYYFSDLEAESAGIDTFNASLNDLMQAFARVAQSIGKESFHEVFEELISIEEKIEQLRRIFLERRQVYFRELFPPRTTRNELIVTFLGILELTRQRFLSISQGGPFDDILLKRKEGAEPGPPPSEAGGEDAGQE